MRTIIAVALVLACCNPPVCEPRSRIECSCDDGRQGYRDCEPEGTGYGVCRCGARCSTGLGDGVRPCACDGGSGTETCEPLTETWSRCECR